MGSAKYLWHAKGSSCAALPRAGSPANLLRVQAARQRLTRGPPATSKHYLLARASLPWCASFPTTLLAPVQADGIVNTVLLDLDCAPWRAAIAAVTSSTVALLPSCSVWVLSARRHHEQVSIRLKGMRQHTEQAVQCAHPSAQKICMVSIVNPRQRLPGAVLRLRRLVLSAALGCLAPLTYQLPWTNLFWPEQWELLLSSKPDVLPMDQARQEVRVK